MPRNEEKRKRLIFGDVWEKIGLEEEHHIVEVKQVCFPSGLV
jgi:hypothetical protein